MILMVSFEVLCYAKKKVLTAKKSNNKVLGYPC